MSFNVTWSRRWRRRDAAPPRRRRRGRVRAYASRARAAVVSRRCRSHTGIDLVTDKPEAELDEDGNELPVKVVELTDEELAARCIVRTRRPFPSISELQGRDAIDAVARESTRLVRQFRDAVARRRYSTSPSR